MQVIRKCLPRGEGRVVLQDKSRAGASWWGFFCLIFEHRKCVTSSKMCISYNSKGHALSMLFVRTWWRKFIYVEPAYVFKWRTVKKDSTPLRFQNYCVTSRRTLFYNSRKKKEFSFSLLTNLIREIRYHVHMNNERAISRVHVHLIAGCVMTTRARETSTV